MSRRRDVDGRHILLKGLFSFRTDNIWKVYTYKEKNSFMKFGHTCRWTEKELLDKDGLTFTCLSKWTTNICRLCWWFQKCRRHHLSLSKSQVAVKDKKPLDRWIQDIAKIINPQKYCHNTWILILANNWYEDSAVQSNMSRERKEKML